MIPTARGDLLRGRAARPGKSRRQATPLLEYVRRRLTDAGTASRLVTLLVRRGFYRELDQMNKVITSTGY